MFDTNYTCSRCGASVTKTTRVCPGCHANLAGIKCKHCGFMGIEADFVNDRCPKCHSTVTSSKASNVKYCRKCSRQWDGMYCEHCGNTNKTTVVWLIIGAIFSTFILVLSLAKLVDGKLETENFWCGLIGFGAGAAYCWFRLIDFWEKRKRSGKTR